MFFEFEKENSHEHNLELVSKELNYLAAILHVCARVLSFCEVKKNYYFPKRKGKYFYTFSFL